MYLKKITKIQNVGKFHKGGISGGEYSKFTLFYAGNGRGKTTLCAILRSLKTGSASHIIDRKTLGEVATPEVQLLLDTGVAKFSNGAWSDLADGLHIFDSSYITENVHVGEEVSTDNRRSLYRVIVGEKGVQLAEDLDALDKTVTDLNAQIASEKKVLQQHVPTGSTVEKYIALADDPDVDKKISAQQGKIKAAEQATEIAARSLLEIQSIPSLPPTFLPLIEKTIEGVSAEAATKLDQHLAKHKFEEEGETWLSTGLQHVADDSCPFCATSLAGNPLVDAYRQMFNAAYEQFKKELLDLKETTGQALSEATSLKAHTKFSALEKDVAYWRSFGEVEFVSPASLDVFLSTLSALSIAATKVLEAKLASPLDKIDTSALEAANASWQTLVSELEACNASIPQANIGIQAIKTGVAAVNKAALDNTLTDLQSLKKRYSAAVKPLADNYAALVKQKAKAVADKDKKKQELDAYDATVLPKYHTAINAYLTQFGAGFSLMKSEKNYVGKVPQWIYTIEINKHAVDITQKPGLGEASFQTAMSAGDRNTLALAFFLAQLQLDPNLNAAIVVFDDPFTSLDEFRRVMTAKTIFRIGQTASQVLVFSHDKYFLNDVFSKIMSLPCETFQISSTKNNSSIEPWDLKREVKEGYLQDHMELQEFHDGHAGDAKTMRTLMRPLLEKYIRYRFPNQIPDGKWLGEMLAIIAADASHPLKPVYQDIDDINQFTAPYHHDPNTAFNEDEVRTFVGRTLSVVGGC